MRKPNKYGCIVSEDVCLEHDYPIIGLFNFCEESPEIKEFITYIKAEQDKISRKSEYERCLKVLNKEHKDCPLPLNCIGYMNALSDLENEPPEVK